MNRSSDIGARIRDVVGAHQNSMLRMAFAYLKSAPDAEDIVQDVLLRFFRAAPVFKDAEHERAWLLRCTINACKNQLKSGWNKNRQPLDASLGYLPQEQSGLLSAVLSLEEKYRLPLHLFYYEGYQIKEIAEIIGEKPATVGTHLARGRELLKQQIGGIENV